MAVLPGCVPPPPGTQGPVGPNPDLRGATSFSQSEYLVYAEAQCRIR